MKDCVFCKLAAKEIDADLLWEDDLSVAFRDLRPQAPVHFLVIPKKHIESLGSASDEDRDLLGHLLTVCRKAAGQLGCGSGFRVVVNSGRAAGQEVFHLHIHVLAGRGFHWPPG